MVEASGKESLFSVVFRYAIDPVSACYFANSVDGDGANLGGNEMRSLGRDSKQQLVIFTAIESVFDQRLRQ